VVKRGEFLQIDRVYSPLALYSPIMTIVAPESKIESLKLAAASAIKPPTGMIKIDGVLRLRRVGFARNKLLRCWRNHPMYSTTSRKRQWPIEGVLPCGHRTTGMAHSCDARLFVRRVFDPAFYFAMDVNLEEEQTIDFRVWNIDDFVVWFGIEFPPPMKW
jgi:hypothetical protein